MRDLCPKCGVYPDHLHKVGCDVERCSKCGHQRFSCGCKKSGQRLKWTGIWPGVVEAEALGWYSVLVPGKGWTVCTKETLGATADLNRLVATARWDCESKMWVV